ncbi:MAG: alpha/beta hydrolase family esterase [Acidobacteriota bacterium]
MVVWIFVTLQLVAAQADLQRETLIHGGIERTYYVHYPRNKRPKEPKPLVFVLHGGGGANAQTVASRTKMNVIADREDFVVIYPAGIDGQWNDGRGMTFRRPKDNSDIDDVGFISSLIDRLVKQGVADSHRIYVMGLSNGGMMTYRLGIEIGHKLAAIASVIANMPVKISRQKASVPLSVLIMNGTADPMVPWNGGSVRILGKEYGEVLSTDQTVQFWVSAAGLPYQTKTEYLDDVAHDGCTVEVDRYAAGSRQIEVVLYQIRGGGHNLPGGNTPDRPYLLGSKCMDINGVEVIWAFFKNHVQSS